MIMDAANGLLIPLYVRRLIYVITWSVIGPIREVADNLLLITFGGRGCC